MSPANLDTNKAYVEVVYRPRSGIPGVNERYKEKIVKSLVETCVISQLYPRTQITVQTQEMDDHGGVSWTLIEITHKSHQIPSASSLCHQRCQLGHHEQRTWNEIPHGSSSLRLRQQRQAHHRSRICSKRQPHLLTSPKIHEKFQLQRKFHFCLWQSQAKRDWSQHRWEIYTPAVQRSTESMSTGEPEDFWLLQRHGEEICDSFVRRGVWGATLMNYLKLLMHSCRLSIVNVTFSLDNQK